MGEKPFDYQQAAHYQRKILMEKEARQKALLDLARSDFDAIVKFIDQNYHPKAIYQWGSLIEAEHFSEISDIDIAVEGIEDPEIFFHLLGEVQKLTSFPLDIVQLEKIPEEYRREILKRGRKIK
jgi:predicted nucleotidyltransferase